MFGLFKRSTPNTDTYELLKSLGMGAPTSSGQLVNSEIAQTLPAVYCAVATIAESIAALPIHVFRKDGDDRQRQSQHYAERLLNVAPNEYQTGYDFKLALLRSVLLRGNGYARINFNGGGQPANLELLHPDSVIVEQLDNGRLRYQITTKQKSPKTVVLLQEEIIHIRYHSDDGIIGKSPIAVCRDSIGLGLAQNEFGASQFKNGITPAGVLEYDKWLDDKQRKNITESLEAKYKGTKKAGSMFVLEGGVSYKPIGLSNQDAEWLKSRLFTVSDIARMFKISPIFLQDYSNSTYSNFGEASRAFLSQSLRPWLTNLQQAFNNKLISERNRNSLSIEFETKDLLRATAEERFNNYEKAIRMGMMTQNECRLAENMPRIEGGDTLNQSWNQTMEQGNGTDE